jgi:hypothetical protein
VGQHSARLRKEINVADASASTIVKQWLGRAAKQALRYVGFGVLGLVAGTGYLIIRTSNFVRAAAAKVGGIFQQSTKGGEGASKETQIVEKKNSWKKTADNDEDELNENHNFRKYNTNMDNDDDAAKEKEEQTKKQNKKKKGGLLNWIKNFIRESVLDVSWTDLSFRLGTSRLLNSNEKVVRALGGQVQIPPPTETEQRDLSIEDNRQFFTHRLPIIETPAGKQASVVVKAFIDVSPEARKRDEEVEKKIKEQFRASKEKENNNTTSSSTSKQKQKQKPELDWTDAIVMYRLSRWRFTFVSVEVDDQEIVVVDDPQGVSAHPDSHVATKKQNKNYLDVDLPVQETEEEIEEDQEEKKEEEEEETKRKDFVDVGNVKAEIKK